MYGNYGGAIFVMAVGAILKWAVTGHVSGLDLDALGTILLVVGAIGLLLSVVLLSVRRRTDVIHQGRVGYGDSRGAAALREVLGAYLRRVRGGSNDAERVLICAGYAQASISSCVP